MNTAFFERPFQAFLEDLDNRIAGFTETMGPDGAGLMAPLLAIRGQLLRQSEDFLQEGKLLQIGVMGQLKSGKSTFVNALLFGGKPVLPRGATPKTANLTVLQYGERDLLRVTFYTREEWTQLETAANSGNPAVALPAREILAMAKSCGGGDDCIGTGARDIAFASQSALERQLGQYVGEAGVLAPFVKSAELFLHNELLRGLAIVDTPGLNDRVYSRVRQTQAYMEKCDVVFYLSAASDFMDTIDAQLLLEQLPEQGVAKLVLICSKYDSGLLDTVWEKGSLAAADADSKRRLIRQAEYVVNRFVECTGSAKLSDTVRSCLPPVFVSAVVDGMVGRRYFSYTDEERRVCDGLALGGELTDEQLRAISNFDSIRTLYGQIAAQKQETLYAKGRKILSSAASARDRALAVLDSRMAGRLRLLEGRDEREIDALRTLLRHSVQLLGQRYEAIFAALRERLSEAAGAMEEALRASAQNAAVLHGRRGIHSVSKTEEVSVSKWYLPWTWGKKKTVTSVWQETYDYYALEEAEDRLRAFVAESRAFVNDKLTAAMDAPAVRAALLSETLLVLGGADVRLDPMYLRALAEEAVSGLQIAPPEVDAQAACERITAEFGREAAGAAQMKALRDALETAVAALHTALADAVRQQAGQIIARLPALTGKLQDGMTDSLHKELEQAERQSADRAAQSDRIQQARRFLQPAP